MELRYFCVPAIRENRSSLNYIKKTQLLFQPLDRLGQLPLTNTTLAIFTPWTAARPGNFKLRFGQFLRSKLGLWGAVQ